jgi:tetratricopeptide (TPR) repeat protein
MKSPIFKLFMILFSFFFLLLSSTHLYANQESRLALLIGNSNYKYAGKLDNPINDVRAIKRVLEKLGFTVLKYEDCSQNTMKRAIDKFGRELKTRDVGLFFYAGHGVQVDGYNYLLPINAKLENENDAEYDCVRAGRILAKMESAGSKTNIVILDACRANPFERAWRRGEKGSGLAFMNAPSGSLIAYSTAPGQTALDGRGKNSPYTRALLQHINKPNITIIQMFQRVRSTVMKQSNKKQIPWESTSLRGDFYFRGDTGINVVNKEKEKPSIIKTDKTRLFVDTEPEDARVRIVNIKPRFYQGIELELGQYLIEASKNGYKTKTILSKLLTDGTKTIYIQLEPIAKSYSSSDFADAEKLYKRGNLYSNLKQYTKAIQDYTQAIDLDPNYTFCYRIRGDAYYELKQYTKAIQDYTRSIDLNPYDTVAYYSRGSAYEELNEYTKAIQDCTKVIDFRPNWGYAYSKRGETHSGFKQYTKAIQDYTQAIDLDPKYATAYNNRAIAYLALKQYRKAIQDYTKALFLDPNRSDTYNMRGHTYENLKQYTKALQDYKKAIDLDPNNSSAYYNRGCTYGRLKQYTKSIQNFTQTIALNPNQPWAYYNRGWTHDKLQQYTKAIKDYTQTIHLDPYNIKAYNNRAYDYHLLAEYGLACSDAKKACDLGNCKLWRKLNVNNLCN